MKKKNSKLNIESNWDKNLTLSNAEKANIKGKGEIGESRWDCSFSVFSCPITQ